MKPFIPVVLGTGREGRRSEKVAAYVLKELQSLGTVETQLIDVREYGSPFSVHDKTPDPKALPWREIAAKAHGFIIVSPEYNHGYPGELKILLDLAYDEYARKPVGLCTVSSGGFGGVRMRETLLPVLIQLGLIPRKSDVVFSNVKELFNDQEEIQDTSYSEKVKKLVTEMLSFIPQV